MLKNLLLTIILFIAYSSAILSQAVPLLEFDATNTTVSENSLSNVIGDDWLVVRNSEAMSIDSDGFWSYKAANFGRIHYVDGGIDPSILIEESLNNKLRFSNGMSSGSWSKVNSVLTQDFYISPDGTLNGNRLELEAEGYINQAVPVNVGSTYTTTFWLKSFSGPVTLRIGTSGSSNGEYKDVDVTDEWAMYTHTSNAGGVLEYPQVNNTFEGNITIGIWGATFSENNSNSSPVITDGISNGDGYGEIRMEDVITVNPPVGTTMIKEWIYGVEQSPISIVPATYAMKNGTTKILMLAPEIDISGNGISIIGDGTNVPDITDNTDFGVDNIANTITKSFTINNLGLGDLILTDPDPYVTITGTDSDQFKVSTAPINPIVGLDNSSFEIMFDPSSSGVKTAVITVMNNDLDEPAYSFNIVAEGTLASGPKINIVGNGNSIASGNIPDVADGTDFGQVSIGSSEPQVFTIQNVGDSDLTVSLAGLYPDLGDGIGYSLTPSIGGGGFPPPPDVVISSEDTYDLLVSFAPVIVGTQNTILGIVSDDPVDENYSINITAEGIAASSGQIDVQGNGQSIVNGDVTPSIDDDTDFGQVENGGSKTTTYSIFNNDVSGNLTIDDIILSFGSATQFSISNVSDVNGPITLPFDIVPAANITFDIIFSPIAEGNYNAGIEINNSDTSENPFQYAVTGEGVLNLISGDIMISQYYEGTTNSKWIEVVNRSESTIPAGTYVLALYDQAAIPNISTSAPTAFESIPELAPGGLVLFSNLGATNPSDANIGVPIGQVITTSVCDFDGNDVILISTSSDATSYLMREDIVGAIPATSWGTNISWIRGGNSNEVPEVDFNSANWIELSPSGDVDVATGMTNVMLGTQHTGETFWDGVWSNFSPDQTRNATVESTYTALNGNLEAYNLIINSGVDLNFNNGTTNSVVVASDLTINGTFTIGDQESLLMFDNDASISGNITKLESSTFRNDIYDITYWSSPISNASIGTVFTGVDQERIWEFEQSAWKNAAGSMTPGLGYAADGPRAIGTHDISFTGSPNNGIISFDIYENPDGDIENDFNLLGNPYPSAIAINRFLIANSTVIWPEIYLWTHTTPLTGGDFVSTDYAILNLSGGTGVAPGADPTNNIGSSQGFMARGIEDSGGLLSFTNGMRIADANDQFFKSSNSKSKKSDLSQNETDRIWLNLTSDQGGFNQILVAFTPFSTDDGIEPGYDTKVFSNKKPMLLYSNINGGKYAIQSLGKFSESESNVSLGFDTNVAPRVLSIGIDKVEGQLSDAKIYLVDNLLNVIHDLQKSAYNFDQSETGSFPDRFTLKFTKSNAGGNGNGNGRNAIVISNSFDNLKVDSEKQVKNAKLYDIFGRLVVEKNPNNKSFLISTEKIKSGTVLILKTTLDDGTVISKKTIKY